MRSIFRSGRGVEDGNVLSRPPFRSIYFILTSAMGLGCAALDIYIIHRYRPYLSSTAVTGLIAVVALPMLYQAIQVFRLVPMIREFYSIASDANLTPDSPLGEAIAATVTGIVNKLFFAYGIILGLLVVIARMLSLRHPA